MYFKWVRDRLRESYLEKAVSKTGGRGFLEQQLSNSMPSTSYTDNSEDAQPSSGSPAEGAEAVARPGSSRPGMLRVGLSAWDPG